jgi:copper(I)-binding protein
MVQVDRAWARPTSASTNTGAVYLTLTDQGPGDSLTGVTTPIAGMAMVHESFNDGGVMRMREVGALPLPPATPVVLKPGGLHIMLEQLQHPLKLGDTFPLTLTFAHASPLTVTVVVARMAPAGSR